MGSIASTPPPHPPKQVSVDTVAAGRYEETLIDESGEHPWKLKSREANAFIMEEVLLICAYTTDRAIEAP